MTLPGSWRSPLDPQRVMSTSVIHWQEQAQQPREEALTVEEPFEVRIGHQSLAVIMRTPGHDHELAMGFLLTEGVVAQVGDVLLAIDGIPLRNSDLQFRFGSPTPMHAYEFLRGQTQFVAQIDSGQPQPAELGGLLLPGLVALEAWLLGFSPPWLTDSDSNT